VEVAVERSMLDWRELEPPSPAAEPVPPPPAGLPLAWVGLAAAGLVLAILGAAWLILAATPRAELVVEGSASGAPPASVGGLLAASASPAATKSRQPDIVVDVEGGVLHPGVYRLAAGSRIGEAIRAAGGYGPRVDAAGSAAQLNLAAVLKDGDQIRVPVLGESASESLAATSAGGVRAAQGSGLNDLNRASASELDTLPGVGPVTAGKIIDARKAQPFASVDELLSRKIVSSSTFEKLRDLVTVGG
jgi:competence protein ComEA